MASLFQGPPAFSFYDALSGLGDTLQKNTALRQAQAKDDARKAAFSTLDPNSKDFGQIATQGAVNLLKSGDTEGGVHMLTLAQAQNQRDQAQANADRSFKQNDQHWNADHALAVRSADRADDPTPDNFEANPDFGKKDGASQYRPIQGGPKDPAYLASVAAAEAAKAPSFSTTPIYGQDTDPNSPSFGKPVIMQAGKNGELVRSKMPEGVGMSTSSPDSIKTRATRYLDTGDPELINRRSFGAGQQGQAQFDSLQNEIEAQRQARGMRPDEISSNKMDYKAATAGATAGARTKAVRETNLDLILRAADAAIPAAKQANAELPRTDWVPLNRLIQKGQAMTSDPRLLKFGMSNLQLAEHWARAMNPTGVMRESDRDKALHFLDTAYGNNTYDAGVDQLRTQIEREKNAVKGGDTGYDHTRINGGRPIKVTSPEDASMYPPGTNIVLPDGSAGVVP